MTPEDLGFQVDDLEEREMRFAKQRAERGWDDSETWSLFTTMAQWIVPRLKRFKELSCGYPPSISVEEWDNILDRMIEGFELIASDPVGTKEEDAKMQQTIDLFHEWYFNLWW